MTKKKPVVKVIDHPLVQHKLTLMRRKDTSTAKFRSLCRETSLLLGYEATRDLELGTSNIETPVAKMKAPTLKGKKPVLVSILRAGNGILDGMLQLMPTAHVGHIGLYRDPVNFAIIEYYYKIPSDIKERAAIVVDPMLATGHSAVAAINRLKQAGPTSIEFLCLLASPEGLEYFHKHHPDVKVLTASIEEKLNEKGYIVPGLGDAGDRLFGTN